MRVPSAAVRISWVPASVTRPAGESGSVQVGPPVKTESGWVAVQKQVGSKSSAGVLAGVQPVPAAAGGVEDLDVAVGLRDDLRRLARQLQRRDGEPAEPDVDEPRDPVVAGHPQRQVRQRHRVALRAVHARAEVRDVVPELAQQPGEQRR